MKGKNTMRKLLAAVLAGTMVFSMAACGSTGEGETSAAGGGDDAAAAESSTEDAAVAGNADASKKLVIWTLAKDLQTFADYYCEKNPDVAIETVVIAPADYPTKVQTALKGGAEDPDIIVAEPQMLETFMDAGFFEDLNQEPYNAQQYAENMVPYVWAAGQDKDGIQRAISYQITPSAIFYRRDIAKDVYGTDDPTEIGKKFADYQTILQTGQEMKDAGYRIFASTGELGYFAGSEPWIVDGKLNVSQARKDFMDVNIELYNQDLTCYVDTWSTTWYQAMNGPIPLVDDSVDMWDDDAVAEAAKDADTTEVFAFGLPSWGVLTLRDNAPDTSGKWGVCTGPAYTFSGGTFIGINNNSKDKELAWDFITFCTTNEETLDWWIDKSEGDIVSWLPSIEKHKDDENEYYGGQKLYELFLGLAEHIDYSSITKYDTQCNDAWNAAIGSIQRGEMSKEDAINNFYDTIESTYPEITVER